MHANTARAHRGRRHWLTKRMYDAGWHMAEHDQHLRQRVLRILTRHPRHWWRWGEWLMILAGQNFCGNWQAPEPPTWWYRIGTPKRQRITGWPRATSRTIEIITDYKTFCERTEGLNEDQMYQWQAIHVSDGELKLGHIYWGGKFYGATRADVIVLRRYLRMWRRLTWFGFRTWLCDLALHNKVHAHNPFSCAATPPPGQGGYSHWHCERKRRHDGLHRVGMTGWGEIGGEMLPCTHVNAKAAR